MVTVIILFLSIYTVFIAYLTIKTALFSPTRQTENSQFPSISIIVPFKNEAHNLNGLLESFALQDYDGLWEIVLVNDGSTDDYGRIVDHWKKRFGDRLKIIDSAFAPQCRLTSKQQALDNGVSASTFDYIVFTDADMTFSKDWLSTCAKSLMAQNDFVFGHTVIRSKDAAPLAAMQRFQLEFLFATAYAFHASNFETSCMGNNIAFRKNRYTEIGGQKGIGYSIVEDRALYLALKKRGCSIGVTEPFSAKAFTQPCPTLSDFFHQTLRWARGGFSFTSQLLPAAMLFSFQNCIFFISLSGTMNPGVAIFSFINFVLTLLFVFVSFSKIKSHEKALVFPLFLLFLFCETIVFGFSFLTTKRVLWKSKKV